MSLGHLIGYRCQCKTNNQSVTLIFSIRQFNIFVHPSTHLVLFFLCWFNTTENNHPSSLFYTINCSLWLTIKFVAVFSIHRTNVTIRHNESSIFFLIISTAGNSFSHNGNQIQRSSSLFIRFVYVFRMFAYFKMYFVLFYLILLLTRLTDSLCINRIECAKNE